MFQSDPDGSFFYGNERWRYVSWEYIPEQEKSGSLLGNYFAAFFVFVNN
jgi:hypothetical protein